MGRKNNIASIKQPVSLIFGVAMILLLFFQQPYVADYPSQEENTEQSQKEEPVTEYRILAYDVLLPIMQINLFHSFDLLLEISNATSEDLPLLECVEKAYHNYFQTLFRLIIAPNAP